MIKWHPAAAQPDGSQSRKYSFWVSRHDSMLQDADAKDGKDFYDGKESPKEAIGEGEAPAEGPPPALPPVPPFTFIPQVVPTSP